VATEACATCDLARRAGACDTDRKERERVADSLIKANKRILIKMDPAIVHDVKTTTAYIDRSHADTLWRHDAVRVAGDTTPRIAIPTSTLARTDSTIRACQQLADDCGAFRTATNATMPAQASKSMRYRASFAREATSGIGAGHCQAHAYSLGQLSPRVAPRLALKSIRAPLSESSDL
jgi:hypothetical protein